MADTKISALTDGVTANLADKIPVERSLTNVYITPTYIQTLLGSITTGKALALQTGLALP